MDQRKGRAPTVFLLAGLTGSGKTMLAKRLESEQGVRRLSVDELVFERNGRYGVDYPDWQYPAREGPVREEIYGLLAELVAGGADVVLDHGLWTRAERDEVKEIVERAGGRWRLIYLPATREALLARLAERNRRRDANALHVTEVELDAFIGRFEPPAGEGEEVLAILGR